MMSLRRVLGAALALGLCASACVAASPPAECGPLRFRGRELRLSRHASERLVERRVACEALKAALAACRPFVYRHERRDKTGCYEPRRRLFVATADGVVLTVIADAAPDYVERLKRR